MMSSEKIIANRNIYISRVNRSVDYIQNHLSETISLERLAQEAGFSPFHFHRIFSSIVQETPAEYIQRVRLELAANWLLKKTDQSITRIAYECGFTSAAVFARAFKKYFGVTASTFRKNRMGSEAGLETNGDIDFDGFAGQMMWSGIEKDIRVINMPQYPVIYTANLQGYSISKICAAWNLLFKWASARDLIESQTKVIGVTFDDPLITPADKCRYYACLSVPRDTPVQGHTCYMEIPEGKYVVCQAICKAEQFQNIYHGLYGDWLPGSGYQPAASLTYEIYVETPEKRGDDQFNIQVCIPVEEL